MQTRLAVERDRARHGGLAHVDGPGGALAALPDLRVEVTERDPSRAPGGDLPRPVRTGPCRAEDVAIGAIQRDPAVSGAGGVRRGPPAPERQHVPGDGDVRGDPDDPAGRRRRHAEHRAQRKCGYEGDGNPRATWHWSPFQNSLLRGPESSARHCRTVVKNWVRCSDKALMAGLRLRQGGARPLRLAPPSRQSASSRVVMAVLVLLSIWAVGYELSATIIHGGIKTLPYSGIAPDLP